MNENAAMTEYTRPIAARGGHLWHTDGTCSHCGADANKAVEDAKRYQAIRDASDLLIYRRWIVNRDATVDPIGYSVRLTNQGHKAATLDAAIDAALLSRTTAPSLDGAVDTWREGRNG